MAALDNRNRNISIVGLIAALVIVYFLFHQGYIGGHSNTLSPPTGSPRLP